MATGYHDFLANQGANFLKTITWQNANITSYTVEMQVKTRPGGTLIATLTTSITDAANGIFTIALTAAETRALTAGVYRYDLELTSPSGFVTRLLEGNFSVKAEVTT